MRGVSSSGGGNGLLGLRERVHVLGGRLSAEPTGDGGHRLWAELPLATVGVSS